MHPVRLVGCGDDHAPHGEAAAGLEQRPGAADVGLERRQRGGVGDPDDRLGGEVKDRVDLVFGQSPLDQPRRRRCRLATTLTRRSVPSSTSAERTTASRLSTVDARFLLDELLHQPAPEQAVGAGDEHRAAAERRADFTAGIIPETARASGTAHIDQDTQSALLARGSF